MHLCPDKSWTLFLDRDGVINHEKAADYIHSWQEFRFYAGAEAAIAALSRVFGRIVVVTNQKGIGKGVTLETDVVHLHTRMQQCIEAAGGRIDAVFYCTATEDTAPCRKPNPGMAMQAVAAFPDIDLKRSLMVGNRLSDLQFGRNAGMHTCFVRTTHPQQVIPAGMADLDVTDLAAVAALFAPAGSTC